MINISRVEEIDFLKDSRILRQSSWSSFFLQMLPPLYCIVSSVSFCSPSPAVVMKRFYILVVSSQDRELVFLICQTFLLRLPADFEEAHVWITNFPFPEQLYPFKSSFQRIWSCIFLTFTTSDMGWKLRQCQLADSGLIQTVFQLTFWVWTGKLGSTLSYNRSHLFKKVKSTWNQVLYFQL